MRGTPRANKRQDRDRAKLQEAGFGAIAIGVAFLLVPLFITNPVVHGALAGLRGIAWVPILGGFALLGLSKLAGKPADRGSASPKASAFTASAFRRREERPEPNSTGYPSTSPGGRMIAAVPSADDKPVEDAVPVAPTAWSSAVFDVIEWRRFEAVCEWLFAQAGFETKTQSHGADGGIDIWLYSKNFPEGPVSVVQCKHWTAKPVKVAEVRALLGSMTDKKVKRGIFATTSMFTHDAKQFARDNGIQLLDRQGLLELIAKRTSEQQQELLAVATKGDYWIPTCASCGVKMMRRSRKRDGGTFWGCVNFPRCMTVING